MLRYLKWKSTIGQTFSQVYNSNSEEFMFENFHCSFGLLTNTLPNKHLCLSPWVILSGAEEPGSTSLPVITLSAQKGLSSSFPTPVALIHTFSSFYTAHIQVIQLMFLPSLHVKIKNVPDLNLKSCQSLNNLLSYQNHSYLLMTRNAML